MGALAKISALVALSTIALASFLVVDKPIYVDSIVRGHVHHVADVGAKTGSKLPNAFVRLDNGENAQYVLSSSFRPARGQCVEMSYSERRYSGRRHYRFSRYC